MLIGTDDDVGQLPRERDDRPQLRPRTAITIPASAPCGSSIPLHSTVSFTGGSVTPPDTNLTAGTLPCSTPGVAALPVATTSAASTVGTKSATFAGTVDPRGTATDFAFEFGTTTAYGSETTYASGGSGSGAVARSAAVNDLSPATTYHYRTVAYRDGTEIAAGADMTLTTHAAPTASITSGPAEGSTSATATRSASG